MLRCNGTKRMLAWDRMPTAVVFDISIAVFERSTNWNSSNTHLMITQISVEDDDDVSFHSLVLPTSITVSRSTLR